MATLNQNIKKRRVELNMTQEELATKTGYKSKSAISKIELGERDLSQSQISVFAKALKTTPSYLMGWQDENGKPDLSKIPGIKVTQNLIKVPILRHIQCGMPVLSECNYEGYIKLDPDLCKADFSLVADGDSMIDANIHEGDIVFFKETPDVESGTIAAVLLDDETTLKKVIKMKDTLILQPANDAYKPILVQEGDYSNVMILGSMVGVFSKRDK
ncbi:LexA family transcriptional regulator [Anaerococcus sp. NML200537]|uniref:LexA family protein n=1 Tax=Anaerococcus sp. NML200537 TaxID=2954485 RepID=UPI002237A244|nr:LexA family transcriptional regulator [Anaerococcus sp. NML200537]MCW6701456.1 LexA family transcriptional regulator [Anaerococcus sp. NML200537]